MRINVYAEEISNDIEIIEKTTPDGDFTGLRMFMYLPVTLPNGEQAAGKFMHHPGDDDSAAITFWGKKDLRVLLRNALDKLDEHYGTEPPEVEPDITWDEWLDCLWTVASEHVVCVDLSQDCWSDYFAKDNTPLEALYLEFPSRIRDKPD